MRLFANRGLIAALGLALFTVAAQAQPKIGTVNLKKVFDNFYKTAQATATLKGEKAKVDDAIKDMVDGFNKSNEEFVKLREKANDQSLSADERTKAKQSADSKLADLNQTKNSIDEFQRAQFAKLDEKSRARRDDIVLEIRGVIEVKAKAATYTLVLDSSGESFNNTPLVLYTDGSNDITQMVLDQLNATAPPPDASAKPDAAKPDAPAKK